MIHIIGKNGKKCISYYVFGRSRSNGENAQVIRLRNH